MDYHVYFDKLSKRQLITLCDGKNSRKILEEFGFKDIRSFDKYNHQKDGVCFALLEHYESLDKMKEWWGVSKSLISHIALAKFNTDLKTIKYSLNNLFNGRALESLERRKKFYAFIENSNKITINSQKSQLNIFVSDEIEVANKDEILNQGWVYSIAEWFESSIVNIKSSKSSFSLSGSMPFSGFIYLCNNQALKSQKHVIDKLNELLKEASLSKNNYLVIEDGEISNIIINGNSHINFFKETYNKERFLYPTEFAFGCLTQEGKNSVDWSQNSLINESTYGFHVGIGMGKETPHLDFICPFSKEILVKSNNSELYELNFR
ncbi:hypothetical protein [Cysteiniphilum halobium]|uniref:hypothetical protein n=1 Tax=Cysteiniphilum halobium TaxID=2219059 RepID=UPI000E65ADCA|nr:hypothetical protein [Cysteiniphilum halobium]